MKFVFAPLVLDARGKFGNAVFSANKSGKYIRNLVIPNNPNTEAQQAVRGRFGGISASWRGLSDAQRQGWNAAAIDYIQSDVFGEVVQLSGFQLFSKLNNSLLSIGAASITNAVAPASIPFLELTLAATASALDITMSGALPAGTVLIVEATRGLSVGRMSAENNEYRQLDVLEALDGDNSADITAAYNAVFGPLANGTKIFVRTQLVATANGQRGQKSVASALIPDAG